jgi:uncharacterized protein YlzI (FlbEa/FlbD family)
MDWPGRHGGKSTDRKTMIALTRMNAELLAIDPDLIERAEATPDTVLTMVDGTKHRVKEDLGEIIERSRQHRASMLAAAHYFQVSGVQLQGA